MMRAWLLAMLGLLPLAAAAAPPRELCLSDARGLKVADARLFDGIGPYRAPPVSGDAQAQRYFEQAMVFGWGFNFAEAARSFRAAVVRDPTCALCRWGIAWAVGPNLNADMDAAELPVARDALVQASAYAADARTRELVSALSVRYPARGDAVGDEAAHRYSDAIGTLADRRGDDADVAVLAAEALMTEHAYDWWRADGTPQPWTPRIVALLDRALRLEPNHPGALHYRIHLYGESPSPAAAVDSAQRIAAAAPGIGHLVHMPAHIYQRVGRYHDAVQANVAAVEADRRYAALTRPDPQYEAGYVVHNQHFLWAAALWSGESALALQTADAIARAASASEGIDPGTQQHLMALPWLTDVRFQRWSAILSRAAPRQGSYLQGVAAFARGLAFVRAGDPASARREWADLESARREAIGQKLTVKTVNPAADVLGVAEAQLSAELAAARRAWPEAIRHARDAETREQALESDEPPAWPLPSQQLIGYLQLRAGAPRGALAAFQRDLERHPANAYSLAGNAEAQRRLGETAPAERSLALARAAWNHADIALPTP